MLVWEIVGMRGQISCRRLFLFWSYLLKVNFLLTVFLYSNVRPLLYKLTCVRASYLDRRPGFRSPFGMSDTPCLHQSDTPFQRPVKARIPVGHLGREYACKVAENALSDRLPVRARTQAQWGGECRELEIMPAALFAARTWLLSGRAL